MHPNHDISNLKCNEKLDMDDKKSNADSTLFSPYHVHPHNEQPGQKQERKQYQLRSRMHAQGRFRIK